MGNAEQTRKHREEASNADKYNCPSCYHMNGKRDLGICMTCQQGDKYEFYQVCNYGGIKGKQFI